MADQRLWSYQQNMYSHNPLPELITNGLSFQLWQEVTRHGTTVARGDKRGPVTSALTELHFAAGGATSFVIQEHSEQHLAVIILYTKSLVWIELQICSSRANTVNSEGTGKR